MFFRLSGLAVRIPTLWAMRSVAHSVGAVLALFVCDLSFTFAADLNCLKGKSHQICLERPRGNTDVVIVTSDNNDPHPATVKGSISIKSGPFVAPVRPEDFLPQYFVVRKSQLGQ